MEQHEQQGIELSLEELQNVSGGSQQTDAIIGSGTGAGAAAVALGGGAVYAARNAQTARASSQVVDRPAFFDKLAQNNTDMLKEIERLRR